MIGGMLAAGAAGDDMEGCMIGGMLGRLVMIWRDV